jgi:hypothetical protein
MHHYTEIRMVFSKTKIRKDKKHGRWDLSHKDAADCTFVPEKTVTIQVLLGSLPCGLVHLGGEQKEVKVTSSIIMPGQGKRPICESGSKSQGWKWVNSEVTLYYALSE